ncbi:MAG TPA: effector binding domain-containing protein, partial [Chitinophagaceae bacterium]|nr:effector binding domain-containing protein [Chitinophagaceae bacterium]
AIRTSNEEGAAVKDIPLLWHRFFSEGISNKIDNKLTDDIYAVYTHYEKDATRPYTTILGHKVKDASALQEGFETVVIQPGNYRVFTATGELEKGIVYEQWVAIWYEPLNRKYSTDFEVYGEKSRGNGNVSVDIFIAVE